MRRVPDAVKAVRGTLRPDRLRPARQVAGVPRARPGLTPLERKYFRRLCRLLGPRVGEADAVVLELTAGALAEYEAARQVIASEGASYEAVATAGGVLRRERPEVRLASDAWRRACRGLVELGLTPAAAQRLGAELRSADADPAAPPDPLAQFVARREAREGRRALPGPTRGGRDDAAS